MSKDLNFDTGLYYVSSRYYDPEIGRWINADTTDILTATPMGLTDKNLFSYCDNNPVMRADHGGRFWDTIFDLFSLGVSFVEVCINPTDSWAWAGLAGDAVDLIPFVTGVGEATRGAKTVNKVTKAAKTSKVVQKADNLADTGKVIKNARSSAVRKAWNNELNNVRNGGRGISRDWTDAEIDELLSKGKINGYQGHHIKSVKGYPNLASDPYNIQFLTRQEHLKAHNGNFRNITHGRYLP